MFPRQHHPVFCCAKLNDPKKLFQGKRRVVVPLLRTKKCFPEKLFEINGNEKFSFDERICKKSFDVTFFCMQKTRDARGTCLVTTILPRCLATKFLSSCLVPRPRVNKIFASARMNKIFTSPSCLVPREASSRGNFIAS